MNPVVSMSAVSLLSLPDDILCHIFQYLTFSTTILCHQICKYFREFLDSHPILYKYYLQKQYFPGYEPFRKRKNMTTIEEKSILTKWFKRQFHWTKISQQQHQNSPADYHEIYGRYLHRSAIIQLPNHDESYDSIVTFGGVTDHGLSCELMSISLHENELSFNKIIYQDPEMVQEIDHTPININPLTPSNNSAYGLCSDVHSNVYMYGGRNLFLRNSGLQSQFDNTLWKYNITRNEWTNLSSYLRPQGSPPGCWGHVLVLYENCLFLFGGSSILGTYRDLWMLNLDHLQNEINQITSENLNPSQLISEHWKLIPLPDDAGPAARGGHGAVLMVNH